MLAQMSVKILRKFSGLNLWKKECEKVKTRLQLQVADVIEPLISVKRLAESPEAAKKTQHRPTESRYQL